MSGLLWPDVAYNEKGELDTPRTPPSSSSSRAKVDEMTSLIGRMNKKKGGKKKNNDVTVGRMAFEKNKAPLSSYLRPNEDGSISRNPSFVLSAAAIESGDYDVIRKISVKDQPFSMQVRSGAFFRITLFFVICSFWANFFIGTIGLQLGDSNQLDLPEQRRLTRLFSIISSLGVVSMPLVGFLLDNLGFAFTATTTVFLGVCNTFFVLMEGSSTVYYCSFVFYSLYRAFLFTYFFAALPKKMGFKYFGILAGISFLVAGITQLSMTSLISYATGTCHMVAFADGHPSSNHDHANDYYDRPDCDVGNWRTVYFIQLFSFFFVFLLPAVDTYLETKQLNDLKKLFGTPARISLNKNLKSGPVSEFKSKPLSPIRAGRADEENSSEDDSPPVF
eukprot:CAMPEP_0118658872 /NCGR_PEP_ID=MMETSP0785-20121206/14800_1 /TAXON_ID=91992 /ORGANISM="Bolidomonas pacifica, Strain CCMP 1866" /LENGTH=389 /DNA_ID=CAMNT_0006551919 /DNA_START=729 /DNA_END=1898 /DNA_ORIENTATION=+